MNKKKRMEPYGFELMTIAVWVEHATTELYNMFIKHRHQKPMWSVSASFHIVLYNKHPQQHTQVEHSER